MKKDSSEQQQRLLRKLARLHKPVVPTMEQTLRRYTRSETARIRASARKPFEKVFPMKDESRIEISGSNSVEDSAESSDNPTECKQQTFENTQQSGETKQTDKQLKKPRKKRIARSLFRHDNIDYIKPKKLEMLQNTFSHKFKQLVDLSKGVYSKIEDCNTELTNKDKNVDNPEQTEEEAILNHMLQIEESKIQKLDMPSLESNEERKQVTDKTIVNTQEKAEESNKSPKTNTNPPVAKRKYQKRKYRKKDSETTKVSNMHILENNLQNRQYPYYGIVRQDNETKAVDEPIKYTINIIDPDQYKVNNEKDKTINPHISPQYYPVHHSHQSPPYFYPHPMIPPAYPFFPHIPPVPPENINPFIHNPFLAVLNYQSNLMIPPQNNNKEKDKNQQILDKNIEKGVNTVGKVDKIDLDLRKCVKSHNEQDNYRIHNQRNVVNKEIPVVQNIMHRKLNYYKQNDENIKNCLNLGDSGKSVAQIEDNKERKRSGSPIASDINNKNVRITSNNDTDKNNLLNAISPRIPVIHLNEMQNSASQVPVINIEKNKEIETNKLSINTLNIIDYVPIATSVIVSPKKQSEIAENQLKETESCEVIKKNCYLEQKNKHSIENILAHKCSTVKNDPIVENISANNQQYSNSIQNNPTNKSDTKTNDFGGNLNNKLLNNKAKPITEHYITNLISDSKTNSDETIDKSDGYVAKHKDMPKLIKTTSKRLNLKSSADKSSNKTNKVPLLQPAHSNVCNNKTVEQSKQKQSINIENIEKNKPLDLSKSSKSNINYVKSDEEYNEYLRLLKEKNATGPYLFYTFITNIQKRNNEPVFDLMTFFSLLKQGKLVHYKDLYNQCNNSVIN